MTVLHGGTDGDAGPVAEDPGHWNGDERPETPRNRAK